VPLNRICLVGFIEMCNLVKLRFSTTRLKKLVNVLLDLANNGLHEIRDPIEIEIIFTFDNPNG
jgi:hypothetical protein